MNLNTFCNCENITKNSEHILELHVKDILSKEIQPVFKKHAQKHPTLVRHTTRYKADPELHEEQLWKKGQNVSILKWIIENANPNDLQANLHLLIPPVLIILDDFDIHYKSLGVTMVHSLITRMDTSFIMKSHLDNVFLESLFHCLYYLSQERDLQLLTLAYPCILELISGTKKGQQQCRLYERVLVEGITTGLLHAGQKIKFLPVLLQPIPIIFKGIGAVGVQYLKAVIPPLCESISMLPSNNEMKDISKIAANGLKTVIQMCWPRIFVYKGIIMHSLAKSWKFYFEKQDTEMLELLKSVYKVFEAACQGKEKADKDALLEYKPDIFESLFV